VAVAILERVYKRPLGETFKSFDRTPIASASIAQVHLAELPDGTPVAVKILRPDLAKVIDKDLALMRTAAGLVEWGFADGRRLRPRAVVDEFEKTIRDELDLSREAANCSQLRRNFRHSPLLMVPAIHWDYIDREVLVMERMSGIPIGRIDELRAAGINTEAVIEPGKLAKQFKYADRAGIRFVLVLGPDEIAKGTVTVKDLRKQDQFEVVRTELAETLRVEIEQTAAMPKAHVTS